MYYSIQIQLVLDGNKENMISIPIYNPEDGEGQTSVKTEGVNSQASTVIQSTLLENLQATKLEEYAAPQPPKMSFEVIKGYHFNCSLIYQ